MSYKVNIIPGTGRQPCPNTAFAIVSVKDGREQQCVHIIPAYEVPGKKANDIEAAFNEAVTPGADNAGIIQAARAKLGLN